MITMVKKILMIHTERKLKYGAHYINDIILKKLRETGYKVDTIYPKENMDILANSMTGISNILFFHSLISMKEKIKHYDIIHGTTYTVLPFLECGVPVISHFGSTTYGFLKKVPTNKKLENENTSLFLIFKELKKTLGIRDSETSIKSLRDISNIEIYVARKSDAIIATSEKVRQELIHNGVPGSKITVIHNAIEDYWFENPTGTTVKDRAEIVYLGRMGDDTFTLKLKGINRLIFILKNFSHLEKSVIGMCRKIDEYRLFFSGIPMTKVHLSVEKKSIPDILKNNFGDIYINPGRYEGFCLSMIEAMSQGLVPITFPVGISPEIIENGKNGYIVNSLDDMIKKINMIKSSPEKRRFMALNAQKTANRFRASKMVEKTAKIYQKLKYGHNK